MKIYTATYWADMLSAAAPDLPTARLVAWIAEESGGNPAALGSTKEVGIFQIDMQDGDVAGGSVQSLHGDFTSSASSQTISTPLTDDQEQLQVSTGITYVRACLAKAQQAASSWDDSDTWCLTKMVHALPAVVSQLLPQASTAGHDTSWADFKGYVGSLQRNDLPSNLHRYYPLTRFFVNCGRVGGASGATDTFPGIAALDLVTALALAAIAAALYFFVR